MLVLIGIAVAIVILEICFILVQLNRCSVVRECENCGNLFPKEAEMFPMEIENTEVGKMERVVGSCCYKQLQEDGYDLVR